MSANKKKSGEAAFNEYYFTIFGTRWHSLKDALTLPAASVAYDHTLVQPYFLDAGSVLAATSLPLVGAKKILDLCAAPGGKSLVLASRMESDAELTTNERSRERRFRLLRVLDEHLPPNVRTRVTVTANDGARWCRFERDSYDCILLDAPCSTERHVMAEKKYLSQWTTARIRNLSVAQWALLSSAFLVLKPHGFLLYATCSLSPAENDNVIKKLLAKYPQAHVIEAPCANIPFICGTEKTELGFHVLPDIHGGAGPLYFSLIGKK